MMQQDGTPPPLSTPRSRWRAYTLVWGVLACGAAGYLGWLSSQSQLLARHAPDALPAAGEGNQGQRALGDAMAEIKSLQDSIEGVRGDVASLKTDIASIQEQNSAIVGRVAALEQPAAAIATTTAASSSAPVAPAAAAATSAQAAKAADGKAAPAAPKVINAPKAAGAAKDLVTGSVAAKAPELAAAAKADAVPVVFGPAVVTKTAKPIGVQIATGPSLDSIRLSWSLLADRHAAELKPLQPRYVAGTGPDGATYNLVAGPIKSAAEAKKICDALEEGLVACQVGNFDGEAL